MAILQLVLATVLPVLAATSAAQPGPEAVAPSLVENVADTLQQHYFDRSSRSQVIPELLQRLRERGRRAETLSEQRQVAHELLAELPISHLGLLSYQSHARFMAELWSRPALTYGFELVEYDGKHFVSHLLEGGPGERDGLLSGDRVVKIDGVALASSPLLDWRTDDAYLPDPPMRALIARQDDRLEVEIERAPGERQSLSLRPAVYSALEAAKSSARAIEHRGRRIAYVHFWYIHIGNIDRLLRELLEQRFAEWDALVLDLRGRGGSAMMIEPLLRILDDSWSQPIVALIDSHSRSAKDVMAYELKKRQLATLVGETTAGAVIPALFADVGYDTYLMFPGFELPEYTALLEGRGVEPDVVAEAPGPYAAGRDPILQAGLREAVRLVESEADASNGAAVP